MNIYIYIYPACISNRKLKSRKTNHSFNDSKRRRMELSRSKKVICHIIISKHGEDLF